MGCFAISSGFSARVVREDGGSPGVVGGELADAATPHEVEAAVADVGDRPSASPFTRQPTMVVPMPL